MRCSALSGPLIACVLLGAGCEGRMRASTDADPGGAGGLARDAGGTGGASGGTGGTPPRVELWEPANPCSTTSMRTSAQSAPPNPYPLEPVGPPRQDQPIPSPLRRLTRLEYANTVRDLLGVNVDLGGFGWDQPTDAGFAVGASVTAPEGRQLLETSLAIAREVMPRLPALLPTCCTPPPAGAAEQEACAAAFIGSLGRRAFRRPLSLAEGNRLLAMYREQRLPEIGHDFPNALRVLVAAMLQAPQFLYRREVGPFPTERSDGFVRLHPYEVASRLSYLFWASMPDEELFTAAATNKLYSAGDIAAQARRLLASPRLRSAVEDFHLQWMEVGDLTDVNRPAPFSPALAQSMLAETREFVSRLFLDPAPARLQTLLTSPISFVDGPLASHYGLPPVSGLQQVRLDPAQRAGIMTQASVLTWHSSDPVSNPTRRGTFLLRRLVCMDLPVPPIDVPLPGPGQTTRERLVRHSMNPCAACHQWIDPAGLPFEHYDGLGLYRATEGGQAIDASGSVELAGSKVAVRDAIELVSAIAASREGAECMARQWIRYFAREREQDSRQSDVVRRLADVARGGDLRDMLVSLTETRLFLFRALAPGEVSP